MKKALKIVFSLCMVAAVTAAFFGVPYCVLACKVQPSAAWPFLVVLALTPLLGRFFCETMCPLGVLQTFVNWASHPKTHVRRVCTRLPVTKPQRAVRLAVLALFAVLLAAGFGGVAWTFTPYSIYGKALALFVPGLVLFVAVLVLALFGQGRIWCNWICPAGTLFTLFARNPVCAHAIGKGCANCRRCFSQNKQEETK